MNYFNDVDFNIYPMNCPQDIYIPVISISQIERPWHGQPCGFSKEHQEEIKKKSIALNKFCRNKI